MGKNTGFMDYDRAGNAALPPTERLGSFAEFHTPLDAAARQEQGGRCMNCGVAFCQAGAAGSGCPLHNLIPEWNDALYHGQWAQALSRLCKTASFPEFTGRVCPGLCESACSCALYGDAVTVRENELAIIEEGFRSGLIQPRPPAVRSGKRVAVVGSGPAGLAVADRLNRRGHSVTVFERDERPGGLVMYGIPNMKLDKAVVARRVALMEREGVVFRCGADVGGGVDAAALRAEYDALVLCIGARQPRPLEVPGRTARGVVTALEYLAAATRALLSGGENPLSAAGAQVVIVGGGDTGNDCVATALRQGCRGLTQLIRKPPERAASPGEQPWPRPIAHNEYGLEEARAAQGSDPRRYQNSVREILADESGHIRAVRVLRSEPKMDGGRTVMVPVPESETELPCGLLVLATGFSGCERALPERLGAALTPRGTVDARAFATARPGVFAAGDARRGASLVVWAIAEGRECARAVDEYLMDYSNLT